MAEEAANCSLLLRHLLVLVLDWAQAGAQEKAYPSRFPKWAAIMGGLLGHHEFADFLGNATAIREQHSEYRLVAGGLAGPLVCHFRQRAAAAPAGLQRILI